MRERPHAHHKALVEVFGAAVGFSVPMRGGQEQAVRQIYKPVIDAVLAAGWEPSGTQALYEKAEAERRRLRGILAELEALAETWEHRGFGVANGPTYAAELRAITKEAP